LHEVLIAEVAASLPAPLAARLQKAPTVAVVHEWLAAGAVYKTVAGDPHLVKQFLDELGDSPGQAGLAVARAFAARLEPPPRDAAWHRRDRLGLALQLILVVVLVAVRGLLFHAAGAVALASSGVWGWSLLPPEMDGLATVLGGTAGGLAAALLLGGAAVWLGLEAALAPGLLERARQLPARLQGSPPPLAWRADTFGAAWLLQATVLFGVVSIRLGSVLVRVVGLADSSAVEWSAALAFVVLFAGLLGMIGKQARSLLKLGTQDLCRRCRRQV
jgi:hypothetical protein